MTRAARRRPLAATVRRTGNRPSTRHVALVLASYATETGLAWPSIATLVADTGYGRRTVQRALRELEAAGVIEPVDGPAFTAQRYQFAGFDAAAEPVDNSVINWIGP